MLGLSSSTEDLLDKRRSFYSLYGFGPWLQIEAALTPKLQVAHKCEAVLETGRVPRVPAYSQCPGLPGGAGCVVKSTLFPDVISAPSKRRRVRHRFCPACCPKALEAKLLAKNGQLTKFLAPLKAYCEPLFDILILRVYYFTRSELVWDAAISSARVSKRLLGEVRQSCA
jgi:hypothetical protein